MNLVGTVTQLEIRFEWVALILVAKCKEIDDMYRAGPVETDTRPKGASFKPKASAI